jgi:chromosome segregation ATPase
MKAHAMSQLAKVKHSRNQWKRKAKERGDQDRYLRKPLARVKSERDQAKQVLQEAQARLRQLESQTQAVAVLPQGAVGWRSLRLF